MKEITIEDVGALRVNSGGVSVELDVIRVNNMLAALQAQHAADAVASLTAQADYIEQLGFPRPTDYGVILFGAHLSQLRKELEELVKNLVSGGLKQNSPASIQESTVPSS